MTPSKLIVKRSMASLALMLGANLSAWAAPLAELKLYGETLRTTTVSQFTREAVESGAIPVTRTYDFTVRLEFDVTGTGVPGLPLLKVIALGESLIAAQFALSDDREVDEALRKMLVAKYGPPNQSRDAMFTLARGSFTSPYFQGHVQWPFAGDMVLIYDRPFMGDAWLTYLNKPRLEQAMASFKAQSERETQSRAQNLKEKF